MAGSCPDHFGSYSCLLTIKIVVFLKLRENEKKFVRRGAKYKAVVSATGRGRDHECKYLLTEKGKHLCPQRQWLCSTRMDIQSMN